jgi:hypothetical protein
MNLVLVRVRSQPAWVIALAFGLLAAGLTAAADPRDHSVIAGVVAVVLLVGLAVALFGRPDGEGWAIYSVLLLPSLALQVVEGCRGGAVRGGDDAAGGGPL